MLNARHDVTRLSVQDLQRIVDECDKRPPQSESTQTPPKQSVKTRASRVSTVRPTVSRGRKRSPPPPQKLRDDFSQDADYDRPPWRPVAIVESRSPERARHRVETPVDSTDEGALESEGEPDVRVRTPPRPSPARATQQSDVRKPPRADDFEKDLFGVGRQRRQERDQPQIYPSWWAYDEPKAREPQRYQRRSNPRLAYSIPKPDPTRVSSSADKPAAGLAGARDEPAEKPQHPKTKTAWASNIPARTPPRRDKPRPKSAPRGALRREATHLASDPPSRHQPSPAHATQRRERRVEVVPNTTEGESDSLACWSEGSDDDDNNQPPKRFARRDLTSDWRSSLREYTEDELQHEIDMLRRGTAARRPRTPPAAFARGDFDGYAGDEYIARDYLSGDGNYVGEWERSGSRPPLADAVLWLDERGRSVAPSVHRSLDATATHAHSHTPLSIADNFFADPYMRHFHH